MSNAAQGGGEDPLSARIGSASSVLLLTSVLNRHEDEACTDLLTVADPTDENVMFVTLTRPPDQHLNVWKNNVTTHPSKMALIYVDEPFRLSIDTDDSLSQYLCADDSSLTTRSVSTPGDLTDLGVAITDCLSDWDTDGNQIVACFHNLTTVAQYVDSSQLFRFLRVLIDHFRESEAIAHFHMNSTAHQQNTVNTIASLFDVVIERTDDSSWAIQSRQ